MKILGTLIVVALTGLFAWSQFGDGTMRSTSNTDGPSSNPASILDDIEEAEIARDLLESRSADLEEAPEAMTDTNLPEEQADNTQETSDKPAGSSMTAVDTGDMPVDVNVATTLVAGGCFWCVEADLEKLSGVIDVVSGYAGGSNQNPTYSNYSKNGHREVALVTYNPAVVSFEEILIYAMKHMDPTDDHGSFYDRGDQYAPAFYFKNDSQRQIIENLIAEVDEFGAYDAPLAVDVEADTQFWPAEDYHQDYYKGTSTQLKYKYYRNASGRDDFIEQYWGDDTGPDLPWRISATDNPNAAWNNFVKPTDSELRQSLTSMQYKVTQEAGTEPSFNNEYWNNKEAGIYVDVVSGEPLFSSTHKFDSGTGWPSFTRPIEYDFVTERADYKLIIPRTEIRSRIADSHLGHVFNDAPPELGGIRYCMNSASLSFVPVASMEDEGYGDFLYLFN